MKDELNIGLVIADDMEYAAYEELVSSRAEEKTFFGRRAHSYRLLKDNKKITINSILCGIGTVNAATATMYLIDNGADIILNYGLSGGISNVHRGEDVVGVSFLEYDFDLTCCGYNKCEKPRQKYVYSADPTLSDVIAEAGGGLKKVKLASGDRFVSDPVLRDTLENEFGINSCDMETAAIAYVADLTETPFASLRRISDDAGEDATDAYREMNNRPMTELPAVILESVQKFFDKEEIWK